VNIHADSDLEECSSHAKGFGLLLRLTGSICLTLLLIAVAELRTTSAQDWLTGADHAANEYAQSFAEFGGDDCGDDSCGCCQNHSYSKCCGPDAWKRTTLLGDCLGLRPCLQQTGITFSGRVTQFAFGVAGGIDTPVPPPFGQGDAFAYTGTAMYDLLFDLQKFGGPERGQFLISLEQAPWGRYGNVWLNTGSTTVTNFAAGAPTVLDNPASPYVTNFLYSQQVSEKLVVAVGKKRMLAIHDDNVFAGGDGVDQFQNQGLIANPAMNRALPFSSFFATAVMTQKWGNFSVYAVDAQDRTEQFFSRLGDLFSHGIIVSAQVQVNTEFFGKPGQHRVGGVWKHTNLADLRLWNSPLPPSHPEMPAPPGVEKLDDSYTVYYGFDQALRVYSREPRRGWGLFGRAAISDGNPTPISYFLSAGIGGYSPWGYDREDKFGIGWYYVKTSSEWGPVPRSLFQPQDQTGLEVYYKYHLTPWLAITADAQYVRPTLGRFASRDSFLYGLRVNMKF
jgi:porin